MQRTISELGAGKFLRLFFNELSLPVLGGVEYVQDMHLSIIEIVDGHMAMPAGSPPDDDITQIGTCADFLAPDVAAGQTGEAFL